eukprot:TRINITY_DN1131_c0_g1_i14.p1 TRINITY_DN1131_c0_g1~~TRINITY_DN1131_c0_g1_i14.p1  ORF type:complete len:186 (-),score=48.60 TRINITY_DN1131_c0_g1_i14:202-759(-)
MKLLDLSEYDVQIKWEPFLLNPSLPTPSIDKQQHYNERFGPQRVRMMQPRLAEAGRLVGINFKFGGKIGNTLNSHRLLAWADRQNAHEQTIEKLFSAYFEQERDINDIDELARIAAEAGLDPEAAKQFLLTDELTSDVLKAVQRWTRQVDGVPFFDFGRGIKFSGAQDVPFLLSVFEELGIEQKE